MGLLGRLAAAARKLLGAEERSDAAREAVSRPMPPSVPAAGGGAGAGGFDFDRIIPPIGSIPPPPVVEGPEDFADFVDLLDLRDEYAQNLLDKGWFDMEVSPDLRHDAREAFFDYMGWEEDDFPWEEWREWYE